MEIKTGFSLVDPSDPQYRDVREELTVAMVKRRLLGKPLFPGPSSLPWKARYSWGVDMAPGIRSFIVRSMRS